MWIRRRQKVQLGFKTRVDVEIYDMLIGISVRQTKEWEKKFGKLFNDCCLCETDFGNMFSNQSKSAVCNV